MPRRSSSSSNRGSTFNKSSQNTSRGSATATAPPKQNSHTQAPARSGFGSAIMGGIVSGMAFGAGSEFIRNLLGGRGQGAGASQGPNMFLPLLLSGGFTYGAYKYLQASKYKPLYLAGVFGASFIITNRMINGSGNENENPEEYNH